MATPQHSELIRLLNKGFPFEIEFKTKKRKAGFWGYFQKKEDITETRQFLIKEPTLFTLDRIALEATAIDDKELISVDNIEKHIKTKRYYRQMAKIIAILVADNEGEEPELEELFFKSLKPSSLKRIIEMADVASNMMDFTSSILSVAAVKTERIEKAELLEQKHLTEEEE